MAYQRLRKKRVKSSMVYAIGYDAGRQELEVEFQGGGIYIYTEVSEQTYRELMEADSIGAYMQAHIIGNYEEIRIR